jgi:hypothetical protein
MQRTARARVTRNRTPIYDGGFHTLRRFQDDVKEVRNGLECGIKLGDFNDYEVGDIVECYLLEKVPQKAVADSLWIPAAGLWERPLRSASRRLSTAPPRTLQCNAREEPPQ